ncbi:MAG: hypothetical protein WBD34_08235, partial [Burkholderiaceae bacterium]
YGGGAVFLFRHDANHFQIYEHRGDFGCIVKTSVVGDVMATSRASPAHTTKLRALASPAPFAHPRRLGAMGQRLL